MQQAQSLPRLDTRADNKRTAFIETIIFLSGVVILDRLFGDGTRYISTGLHPFWAIVLLVTLQYGPREALTTALLASAFLLIGNMPEQNLTENMYQYILRVTFLPFMWTAAALILGSIRLRQINEKNLLADKLTNAEEATDAIAKAYKSMKQMKEQLEMRIAEERCSVLTVCKVAKSLDSRDPADMHAAVMELVRVSLHPNKFSLYRLKDNGLHLETSHGWESPDEYAAHLPAASPLAKAITGAQHALHIARETDQPVLGAQGLMAGAIRDKGGKVYGMLKIEDIGFMEMNARTQEMLQVVCEWIGHAYAREGLQAPTAKQSVPVRKNKIMPFIKPHVTLSSYSSMAKPAFSHQDVG